AERSTAADATTAPAARRSRSAVRTGRRAPRAEGRRAAAAAHSAAKRSATSNILAVIRSFLDCLVRPRRSCARRARLLAAEIVVRVLQHLIGRRDRLRIDLVRALRLDHVDELLNGVDVRALERALH